MPEKEELLHPYTHAARVHLVSAKRSSSLYEAYMERGHDFGDLREEDLYFWDAEISNTLIDSYFTHMSLTTLRNYADDAQAGVAFLKGHNWKELPIGYSLSGSLEENEERTLVMAGFYTVRGLDETDSLIRRMEAKILRDVSVGFHGGETTCDICGRDIWDWDCRHMPGLTYEEKKGDKTETVLSTFTIDDARLSEVSGVFDGSTPEAMIRKAQHVAKAGELTRAQAQLLESRYRIALPTSATYQIVAIPATDDQRSEEMTEEQVAKVRSVLGLGADGDVLEGLEKLNSALSDAEKRIKELEPRAKEGEQYRNDLVEAALAEGVRAQGDDFDKELYEETLKNAPLAVVKRMRDDWKKVADASLPAGRNTTDVTDSSGERRPLHPDKAYA